MPAEREIEQDAVSVSRLELLAFQSDEAVSRRLQGGVRVPRAAYELMEPEGEKRLTFFVQTLAGRQQKFFQVL